MLPYAIIRSVNSLVDPIDIERVHILFHKDYHHMSIVILDLMLSQRILIFDSLLCYHAICQNMHLLHLSTKSMPASLINYLKNVLCQQKHYEASIVINETEKLRTSRPHLGVWEF